MLASSGRTVVRRLGPKRSSECASRALALSRRLLYTNNTGAGPLWPLSSFGTINALKFPCQQYSTASTSTKASANEASTTTRKPATKKKTATKKAAGRPKKKTTKTKAKPKPKRPKRELTEAQQAKADAKKARDNLAALKATALYGSEPKELPSTAAAVILVEIAKPGMKAVDAMREAHARHKQLTPDQLEVRLSHL